MIRYGTAGWDFKDWAGKVYPQPKPRGFDPLAYLADFLTTIEINSSFYRPPTAAVARKWCERVAHVKDFAFTAKISQRFTHERATVWTRSEVDETRTAFAVMMGAGRLGCVLLQFPWSFRNTDESREWLFGVTDAFADFPLVLEVRHATWNTAEIYAELTERGIGIANIDQPLFHNSIKPGSRSTSAVGYVRIHGRNYHDWFRGMGAGKTGAEQREKPTLESRNDRYNYLYTAPELQPWAERIAELNTKDKVREVFVIANNHYEGRAAANVLMLRSMVEGKPVPAPEKLMNTYHDALADYAMGTPAHG